MEEHSTQTASNRPVPGQTSLNAVDTYPARMNYKQIPIDGASPPEAEAAVQFVCAEFLAQRYDLSPRTIQAYGRTRFLPSVKLSRRVVRFPLTECDAVMESHRQTSH